MRTYRLAQPIGVDGLRLTAEDPPELAPRQVLIRVRAASLNARDQLVLHGALEGQKPNVTPLSDGAGHVLAVGSDVTGVSPGDRVVGAFRQGWVSGRLRLEMGAGDLGGRRDGMLSEWCVLNEDGVVVLPASVSSEAAAALPCAGVTAWSAVMGSAAPGEGATVLVQGSGGVSIFALQLARLAGARVIATTSSDAKAERLSALGCEHVINYRRQPDWQDVVLELTGGEGVDKVVEVGGPGALERSMQCVRPGGEIAFVGLLDSPGAHISPLPLMRRTATLRGVAVGPRDYLQALVDLVADGSLTPLVDTTFEFEDVRSAFARLASGKHMGKVMVRL